MKLCTGSIMREADRRAVEVFGLDVRMLMESAGAATASAARSLAGKPGLAVFFCGKGNNGGDGLAAARYWAGWGWPAAVFLVGQPAGPAAQYHAERLLALGVQPQPFQAEAAAQALAGAVVAVDALLGTGIRGEPRGALKEAIALLVAAGQELPVVACDLPSGLDPDSGACARPTVRASLTVSYARAKWGLFAEPGADYAGRIEVADIGIPEQAFDDLPAVTALDGATVARYLPPRPASGHKGTFGTVLTVGGSSGLAGAPVLAGQAALRSGAGLSVVAVPESIAASVEAKLLEVTVRALPATAEGALASGALPTLAALGTRVDAVVCGPGLGQAPELATLLRRFLNALPAGLPAVLDADALNNLSLPDLRAIANLRPLVLTPHPGEAARLLGSDTDDVQADRLSAVQRLAQASGAVAVLKGRHTLLARPEGEPSVNLTGNAGLATGGSGDVLAGLVGGLLAQGASAWEAACSAVYLHGAAADRAVQNVSQRALLAGDLLTALGSVFLQVEAQR